MNTQSALTSKASLNYTFKCKIKPKTKQKKNQKEFRHYKQTKSVFQNIIEIFCGLMQPNCICYRIWRIIPIPQFSQLQHIRSPSGWSTKKKGLIYPKFSRKNRIQTVEFPLIQAFTTLVKWHENTIRRGRGSTTSLNSHRSN